MDKAWSEFVEVMMDIRDKEEMSAFLKEILTPKEALDISLRWQLLKALHKGRPQRDIASSYSISLCKITRGSRILKIKNSVCLKMLNRMV